MTRETLIPQHIAQRMATLLAFIDNFRPHRDALFESLYGKSEHWTVRDEVVDLVDQTTNMSDHDPTG